MKYVLLFIGLSLLGISSVHASTQKSCSSETGKIIWGQRIQHAGGQTQYFDLSYVTESFGNIKVSVRNKINGDYAALYVLCELLGHQNEAPANYEFEPATGKVFKVKEDSYAYRRPVTFIDDAGEYDVAVKNITCR